MRKFGWFITSCSFPCWRIWVNQTEVSSNLLSLLLFILRMTMPLESNKHQMSFKTQTSADCHPHGQIIVITRNCNWQKMSEWNCFMMKTEKASVESLGPWCWRKVTSWGLTSVNFFAGHVGENREHFLKELGTNMAFHKQLTSLKSSQFGWENWNEAKLLSVLHLELW